MLTIKNFDEIATAVQVAGATKSKKHNFFHNWHGWVSKEVLHVVTTSGAATRPIWHFPLAENAGKRLILMLKNTTGEAYVYIRPGAQNVLEEVALGMSQHCRFERQLVLDVELQTRGTGCGHCTDNRPYWFVVLTDGEIELLREGPKGCHAGANYKYECPEGADTVRVKGGTYAIQIDVHQWRSGAVPKKVVTTPQANLAHVAKILQAEEMTRRLSFGYTAWANDGSHHPEEARLEIIQLATEVAEGYPYPDDIRERTWKLCGEYEPACFLPEGLRDKVSYLRPSEVAHRALVEEVVSQIKRDFHLYQAKGCDEVAVFLPKSETPNWDSLLGFNGKVCRWSHQSGYRGTPRFPEKPEMQKVSVWPIWVDERVREACEKSRHDLSHVPENLQLAADAAIVVIRKDYWESSRYGQVMIVNGRDPNVGFGRVLWNRFWNQRAA